MLDQLDLVRLSLPAAFAEAEAIVQHKEEILLQAEEYGQQLVEAAEARAAEILDESNIIRQAQQEADRLRQQVQQECKALHDQTITEADRLRRQAQQELDEIQRRAISEAKEIQQGADEYADRTLSSIEQQLNDMLRIIRNGRQQLYTDKPPAPPERNSAPKNNFKK